MKNLLRTAVAIAGIAIGPSLVVAAFEFIDNFAHINLYELMHPWASVAILVISAIVFGVLFLLLSRPIADEIVRGCTQLSGISRGPRPKPSSWARWGCWSACWWRFCSPGR